MKTAELVSLARQLAPLDLGDWPLYILRTSEELPTEFSTPVVCGLTHASLDLAARPWLESQGRWRGRGPCILIADQQLAEQAAIDAGLDPAFTTALYHSRMLAILLHELAHVLSRPFAFNEDLPRETGVMLRCAIATWQPPEERERLHVPRPWAQHEASPFIRLVCHLATRAEALLGFRSLAEQWLLGRVYGVRPWHVYAWALGNELDDMADTSFSTIRELPLPPSFVAVWREDMASFFSMWNEQEVKQ